MIGAGFGGLAVARGLLGDAGRRHCSSTPTTSTRSSRCSTRWRRPGWTPTTSPTPVRGIVAAAAAADGRQRDASGWPASSRVDLAGRTVAARRRRPRRLRLAGAWRPAPCSHDFGVPGVAEHTFAAEAPRRRAVALRAHVLEPLRARRPIDPSLVADGVLDVVICGGGPTGVEMAGGLRELYTQGAGQGLPAAAGARRPASSLVEMADRLLAPFTPALVGAGPAHAGAARRRGRLGVGRRRGRAGTASTSTDGTTIPAGTIVWATGVDGRAAGRHARHADRPAAGGSSSSPTSSCPAIPRSSPSATSPPTPGADGAPLPQVAQPAIQGGKHVARQILRRLDGRPTEPFRYHDKGQMATIGRHDAVDRAANGMALRRPDRLAGVARPAPRLPRWGSATASTCSSTGRGTT